MIAAHKPRPRSTRLTVRRTLTTLFAADLLTHIRSWEGATVTVRLRFDDLVAGRVPPMPVGSRHYLAPSLGLDAFGPVPDGSEYFSDCDPVGDWWGDDTGAFCCRASLIVAPGARTGALDIAGRGFLIEERNPGLERLRIIEATGHALLDPKAGLGGEHEGDLAWCRDDWTVAALRHYAIDDRGLGASTELDRLPDPRDVQAEALYVADLVGSPDR